MEQTIQLRVEHGYLVLFLFVVAEQLGLPMPSIPVSLAAGALSRTGRLDLALVLAVGVAASLLAGGLRAWLDHDYALDTPPRGEEEASVPEADS